MKKTTKETRFSWNISQGRFTVLPSTIYMSTPAIPSLLNRYPNQLAIRHLESPTTTICFNGCETSVAPACPTNSAGVREIPWQTHRIRTSEFV